MRDETDDQMAKMAYIVCGPDPALSHLRGEFQGHTFRHTRSWLAYGAERLGGLAFDVHRQVVHTIE